MRYLSLFSGIGGFEKGIEQAYENIRAQEEEKRIREEDEKAVRIWKDKPHDEGAEGLAGGGAESQQHADGGADRQPPVCVGFSEIDRYAIQTYQKHYPNHKNYGDITKISEEELPDFDLLVGGFPCQSFSIAGKRRGFADTRGTLFFDIARILKSKRPRLLLLENVKGLLSHDGGNTFYTIVSALDELGYDIQWQVLNSKDFGVPQNRERVLVVGHLRGTSRPEVFPIGKAGGTADEGPYQADTKVEIASTIRSRYGNGSGSHVSEKLRIRRLTPVECERLQGFPDNWTAGVSDSQRYKQCGNAVTVNVIWSVMERLLV